MLAAFLLANLAFLICFADRDGYEGDDLNSIVPMFHLADAREGLLLIYRYAWQPLSYEAGATLYRLIGSPDALFLMAPVAGAVALMLLLWQGWREMAQPHRLLAALAVLLTVPEFWYSGLYYNSSILALPFLVGAIILTRGPRPPASMLVAGALAGIATLMRLDFVLACPLLAALVWTSQRRLMQVVLLTAGVLLILVAGLAAGIVEPATILETYRASSIEIAEKVTLPGWDLRTKLTVWSVTFTPVGWLILLIGGPVALMRSLRSDPAATLICLLAAVPLLVPTKDLLSVKYALPLLAFAPVFVGKSLTALVTLSPRRLAPRVVPLAMAGGLAFALLSVSVFGHAPFIKPGLMPSRTIGTHDGDRSYGGYLWMMMALDGPTAQSPAQRQAARLAHRFISAPGPDMAIVGSENFFDPGGVGWRHLQLELERNDIHGTLAGPHRLRFTHKDRHLWLIGPGAPLPRQAKLIIVNLSRPSLK